MFKPILVQPHITYSSSSTPYPQQKNLSLCVCLPLSFHQHLSPSSHLPQVLLFPATSHTKNHATPALLLFLVFVASISYILLRVPPKKLPTLLKSVPTGRLSLQPASGTCGDLDGAAATAREQQLLQKRKERQTMSAERRAEVKRVFAMFDRNLEGLITRQELRESLRGVGISVSDAELEEAVTGSDADGDGRLNLDEFCGLLESISTASGGDKREAKKVGGNFGEGDGQEAELKEAFDVFDRDRDGVITVEELRLVLSSLGMREGKRTEECEEMIRKVDVDGDGRINLDEFKRMMMRGSQTLLVST